jgi:hypothetical protein
MSMGCSDYGTYLNGNVIEAERRSRDDQCTLAESGECSELSAKIVECEQICRRLSGPCPASLASPLGLARGGE